MRKVILIVAGAASAIVTPAANGQTQADAAANAETAGKQAPPTTIVYPDKGPNGMSDFPMGVHRIPDSSVVISGHQKGGGIGMLFGLAGMLVQSSANAETGTAKVRNVEDDLRFDVAAKAAALTNALVAEGKYSQVFSLTPTTGGRTLSVVPYVVITFQGDNEVRPYVVVKTKLSTGTPGESVKTVKYFCCEGKPLPLSGDNGLVENNGARLKELLASELETAVQVMLMDRAVPLRRDDQAKIAINGYFPFVGKPLKWKGYDLGRYKDYSLIEIRGGAIVFGGVNIAEPGSLKITPIATK